MHSPPPPYSEFDYNIGSDFDCDSIKKKLSKASLHSQRSFRSPSPPRKTVKRDTSWLVSPNTYDLPFMKAARYHFFFLIAIGVTFLYLSRTTPQYIEQWAPKEIDGKLVEQILVGAGAAPLPAAMVGFFSLHYNIPGFLCVPATYYSMMGIISFIAITFFAYLIVIGLAMESVQIMVFAVIQVAIFYLILQYLFNGYRVMLRVKNDMLDDWYDENPDRIPDYRLPGYEEETEDSFYLNQYLEEQEKREKKVPLA